MKKISEGIFLKDSGVKGKTVIIMVGVHGNESSGIEALNDIINDLKIIAGKVYFIYANLKGIKIKKRFYEKDMNRCFLKGNTNISYEDIRSIEIMKYLDKGDYLLDIHNTINSKSSVSFLISEHNEFGQYFDVDYVISGFDNLHPGGSDGYMNSIGKKGLCIECGSINYGDKEKSKLIATKSILNFLKYTCNIDGIPDIYIHNKRIKFDYIYKNNTLNFIFNKDFRDFEFIKSGTLIALDGGRKIIAENDCYIIFCYNPTKISDECFCLGQI